MPSYQNRNPHVKDKDGLTTVLSSTWKSSFLGKTVFILRRGPERGIWDVLVDADDAMVRPAALWTHRWELSGVGGKAEALAPVALLRHHHGSHRASLLAGLGYLAGFEGSVTAFTTLHLGPVAVFPWSLFLFGCRVFWVGVAGAAHWTSGAGGTGLDLSYLGEVFIFICVFAFALFPRRWDAGGFTAGRAGLARDSSYRLSDPCTHEWNSAMRWLSRTWGSFLLRGTLTVRGRSSNCYIPGGNRTVNGLWDIAFNWVASSFMIGWSNYNLVSHCIVGSRDRWQFPPFSRPQWQSLCTALTAGKCLPLGLGKGTAKESHSALPWMTVTHSSRVRMLNGDRVAWGRRGWRGSDSLLGVAHWKKNK